MASTDQELRHRETPSGISQQQEEEKKLKEDEISKDRGDSDMRRRSKSAMAKRGLRSLGIAIALPLSLTLLDIALFGSSRRYVALAKPFWAPRLWALHLACLGWAFLMGLSSWLVWAEGGFHKQPLAMVLYFSQLSLGLAWDPVVFRAGADRVGLVICAAVIGTLIWCSRTFRSVNPIAGDLVKPCLLWALLLTLVNVRIVYG